MLLVAVKNGLGLIARDIVNIFYMSLCAENIWSCCCAEFGTRCGAVLVLKQALYGLNTASNSFQKYFGDFLRDIGFPKCRSDKEVWIHKSDNDEGY